jgi:hypothetical protein
MKKIVKLTESDLMNIIKRVIKEEKSSLTGRKKPVYDRPVALAGCTNTASYECMNCSPSSGSPSWCPSGVSSIYGPAINDAISSCGCTAISSGTQSVK